MNHPSAAIKQLQSCAFRLYAKFMSIGEVWDINQPVNQERCLQVRLPLQSVKTFFSPQPTLHLFLLEPSASRLPLCQGSVLI